MQPRTAAIRHPCVTSHRIMEGGKPYKLVIVVETPSGEDCGSEARVNHWYRFTEPVEAVDCRPRARPYSLEIRITYGPSATTVMLKCG